MSCTPLLKAAKPVWAKQLTRLPCLVVYVTFQFVSATKTKMGSPPLLATTSSQVQISRGFEEAFNECLGVSNVFPIAALVQTVVIYFRTVNGGDLTDRRMNFILPNLPIRRWIGPYTSVKGGHLNLGRE